MSGIYSRQNYDDCYYPILKKMTEGSIKHNINDDKIYNNFFINHNVPTNSKTAFMSSLDYQNIESLIDLESHLKNLDIPLSHQIEGRTILERNEISKKISDKIIKKDCSDEEFTDLNTRLENPPIFIRETTITRFDYPIVPHTSYLYDGFENTYQIGNSRSGVNTRLMAKDSFTKDSSTKDSSTKE
jgi:hypothetical protein